MYQPGFIFQTNSLQYFRLNEMLFQMTKIMDLRNLEILRCKIYIHSCILPEYKTLQMSVCVYLCVYMCMGVCETVHIQCLLQSCQLSFFQNEVLPFIVSISICLGPKIKKVTIDFSQIFRNSFRFFLSQLDDSKLAAEQISCWELDCKGKKIKIYKQLSIKYQKS